MQGIDGVLEPIDIIDLNGCYVRDEDGFVLAILREEKGHIVVKRTTVCSIGTYFYILVYLTRMGFDVR